MPNIESNRTFRDGTPVPPATPEYIERKLIDGLLLEEAAKREGAEALKESLNIGKELLLSVEPSSNVTTNTYSPSLKYDSEDIYRTSVVDVNSRKYYLEGKLSKSFPNIDNRSDYEVRSHDFAIKAVMNGNEANDDDPTIYRFVSNKKIIHYGEEVTGLVVGENIYDKPTAGAPDQRILARNLIRKIKEALPQKPSPSR